MSLTARLDSESLPIGAPFSGAPSAPLSAEIVYREFGVARPLPLANTTSLASLMGEFEADQVMSGHLAQARRNLATQLYSDEPETLSALRLAAGFSQAQLADRAETTQAHIARIEAGKTDPSTDTVARIAQALGVREELAFRAIRNQRDTRG